jgi:hypothetical protein
MALSPQQVADKWASQTKASTGNYIAGVRGCQVNPGELAAQAQDKYAAGVQEAVSSGRYADGCRSVSPSQWKDACEKTGAQRISSGVDKGKAKAATFFAEFLPQQAVVTEQTKAMPSTTLEDRLARMVAQARGVAALRMRKRR